MRAIKQAAEIILCRLLFLITEMSFSLFLKIQRVIRIHKYIIALLRPILADISIATLSRIRFNSICCVMAKIHFP